MTDIHAWIGQVGSKRSGPIGSTIIERVSSAMFCPAHKLRREASVTGTRTNVHRVLNFST